MAARQRVLNPLEQEAHDALISHQIDLFRLEAGVRARVFATLDQMTSALVQKLLNSPELSTFSKARLQQLLASANKLIDSYYGGISDEMDNVLSGAARLEFQQTLFSAVLDTSIPSAEVLAKMVDDTVIMGAPSSDWWDRQSGDAQFRFASTVRQGMASGDTAEEIARTLRGDDAPGFADLTRANAKALVNSSIATVSGQARLETFRQNDDVIQGVQQVSTLDGRTTDICIAYSGGEWTLDGEPLNGTKLPFDNGPPRHWNCRSVLVPIIDAKATGLDLPPLAERAAEGGTVGGGTSFNQWLKTRTVEQQNEQLGTGRAELWRKGKITLTQLLDQSGNPLNLSQLEERVKARSKGNG